MDGSNPSPPSHSAEAARGRSVGAWKIVIESMFRHPYLLVGWQIGLVASCVAALTLPLLVSRSIDGAWPTSTAFILCGLTGLSLGVTTAVRSYCVTLLGEHAGADLKRALFSHLLHMDAAFFDRTQSGELSTRMTTDIGTVRIAIGAAGSVAVRCTVTGIGAVAMLFASNLSLGLCVVAIAPILVVTVACGSRRIRIQAFGLHTRMAEAFSLAGERLAAQDIVRAYGRESAEVAQFKAKIADGTRIASRLALTGAITQGLAALSLVVGIILTLRYGVRLVDAGQLTHGELVQFGLYVGFLLLSLVEFSHAYVVLSNAHGALAKVDGFLKLSPIKSSACEGAPRPSQYDACFANVSFSYSNQEDAAQLAGVSFTARHGKITALVGASGSGKSTILTLLQRFYEPHSGEIFIGDTPCSSTEVSATRALLTMVPQLPIIFKLSAAENIGYGEASASREDIVRAAVLANADQFIKDLPYGYGTQLGRAGNPLSGGEIQRIALARAFVSRAPILLLDEPTSALDAINELQVIAAIRAAATTRTTIVVTHRPSMMMAADHIVVLDRGKVIGAGTHDVLLSQCHQYASIVRDTHERAHARSLTSLQIAH